MLNLSMKSLWQSGTREEIVGRVRALTPERPPKWGKLTAPKMLAHISDQIRMALGDIPARRGAGLLSVAPINYLLIYVVPWPHGAKGPSEAFTTKPASSDTDVGELLELIKRFCDRQDQQNWPEDPLFGRLSGKDWRRFHTNTSHIIWVSSAFESANDRVAYARVADRSVLDRTGLVDQVDGPRDHGRSRA